MLGIGCSGHAMNTTRLDEIYEAAVVVGAWPKLLENIGRDVGAIGGLLFCIPENEVRWTGSRDMVGFRNDFVAEGWYKGDDRITRLRSKSHPGFVTEESLYPEGDLNDLPVRKNFLVPRGLIAADATYISGITGEPLVLSIEGFKSHEQSRDAIAYLDSLRPHLARAALLSAQFRLEKARAVVSALNLIGCAAGLIGRRGNLVAANSMFEAQVGTTFIDATRTFHLAEPKTDKIFHETLTRIRRNQNCGRSIVVGGTTIGTRSVLHIIPVSGSAQDVFVDILAILLIARPRNYSNAPDTQLIQDLFDLTASEARVAASIASGSTLKAIATKLGISRETARTHLKKIFSKVGVARQTELVALVSSIAPP